MAPTILNALAAILLVSCTPLAAAAPKTLPISSRQTAGNCTSSSFTVPSWYIREFKTTSATDASFSLQNRATGSSTVLSCKAAGSEGALACTSSSGSDPSLQVALQVKDAKANIQVQQAWSCNDRDPSRPLAFKASGKSTVPLACDGTACKSSNPIDLIRGSLLAPVELSPAYAEGPPGHNKVGCSEVSEKPRWAVGTVIYLNETGDGDSAVATHSIQFQLTNMANGYVAGCLNYFDVPENEDPAVQINCGGGADFARRNRYSIRTQAVFYPRSHTLAINETWYCDDVDAAKPVSYTGTTTVELPLTCSSENGRTACEVDQIFVVGKLDSKVDLVPYSIEDPLPTADGCTISSVVSPSWTVSNFEVSKNASETRAPGAVAFNLKLNTKVNLFDYPVYINHKDMELSAPDSWYPCSFGAGEQPLAPKNCTFQYVDATKTLAVNAEWACMDLDSENPILFNGIATTKLPELDCVTTASGLSRCRTKEGFTWVAEVSNVKWRTEHSPL